MTIEESTIIIAQELTLAYMQASKPMPKETLLIVAASLANALQFNDEREIRESFRRAKDIADVPTQRVLKEAITNHRRENMPQPKPERLIKDDSIGSRVPTFEQKQYMFATSSVCGIWPYPIQNAMEIIRAFEADPKNAEYVANQRAWCKVILAQRRNNEV